jgi:S1-C subfamily serine protease
MNILKTLTIAAGMFLGITSVNAWELSKMNDQIEQTSFIVNQGCSGTLVDLENRYVLSAEHCVTNLTRIVEEDIYKDDGTVEKVKKYYRAPLEVSQIVRDNNGNITGQVIYRAKLIRTKRDRDLALIQIVGPISNTQSAVVAKEVTRGETAYIIGNPIGLNNNLTKGVVSYVKREIPGQGGYDNTRKFTQVDGGVWFGNSGGGVFNENGELLGVAVMVFKPAPHIALAVDLDDIKAFLKDPAPTAIYGPYR